MTQREQTTARPRELCTDLPEGMVEYEAGTAIRDLIRVLGFETARERVAEYLNREAEGRRSRQ